MKLTDLALTPAQTMREINSYLKESFGYSLNQANYTQDKISRALTQLKKQQWDMSNSIHNYQNNSQYVKSVMVAESLRLIGSELSSKQLSASRKSRSPVSESVSRLRVLLEQDLDQAEVALAAKSIAEDLQDMAEKTAKLQVETMMALVDKMKQTHGTEEAQQFDSTVGAALTAVLEALKTAHDTVSNAAAVVAGEEPQDMDMGTEPDLDMDMAEPEAAGEMSPGLAGADAAAGPVAAPIGRELK